jgi:hypothetical protein
MYPYHSHRPSKKQRTSAVPMHPSPFYAPPFHGQGPPQHQALNGSSVAPFPGFPFHAPPFHGQGPRQQQALNCSFVAPFQGFPHQPLQVMPHHQSFNFPSSVPFQGPPQHESFRAPMPWQQPPLQSMPFTHHHSNIANFASVGVATHHPTLWGLTEIFECTPFGNYCRVCKNHVGASHQMITKHLDVNKHGFFSKEAIKAFKTIADKEVERLSRQPNHQSYIRYSFNGFACPCGAVFPEMKVLTRHCKEVKSCTSDPKDARSELLYKTVCGRTVSKATLDRLRSLRRTAVQLDYKPTEEALLKYIRADESIDPYINLFQPIFASSQMNYNLVGRQQTRSRS